jgi:outer membrane receptor protein involved in Fe transport
VELARNVPGLYITDLGPGQSQVAIRGISAGQVVRDQAGVKESVGIYLDESPVSIALFTPDLDLYDLDRIEVLLGPQGTLFGAGSSSGTVRYITAQPKIGDFSGSADLTLNDVTSGDFGGSVRGSLNVPVGESAAMRVVGYYSELPGFIDPITGPRTAKTWWRHARGGRIAFRFSRETFRSRHASSTRSWKPTAIRVSMPTTSLETSTPPPSLQWTRANAARSRSFARASPTNSCSPISSSTSISAASA